eukprot:3479390-Pleurochrysis_carterae.AAC.1
MRTHCRRRARGSAYLGGAEQVWEKTRAADAARPIARAGGTGAYARPAHAAGPMRAPATSSVARRGGCLRKQTHTDAARALVLRRAPVARMRRCRRR